MRVLSLILLFLIFFYSLGLVLVNNNEVAVNLLFSQAPAMNLGLLLIICLILGILIGMLLALQVFRVIQNKWEISRLQKENKQLHDQLTQANITIDRQNNKMSNRVSHIDAVVPSHQPQPVETTLQETRQDI